MSRDLADLFLHDTPVADIFIAEYLNKLEGAAVKIYVSALFFMDTENQCKSKILWRHLGMKEEDFKASVCELASHQLVEVDPNFESIRIVDIKRVALDRYYRRTTSQPMGESVDRVKNNKERESLIRSINDSYFAGLMGPSWYQAIDSWFEKYNFEPAVVYQMFGDASKRGTLHGPNYLNKVAEDYHDNGVQNFSDLSRYKEETKLVRVIGFEVGKKLNKKMTEYDFAIVQRWVIDFGYDFSVIEVALRNATKLSEPNLHYFDKILETWHKSGIKTSKEAENIERNRQFENRKRTMGNSRNTAAAPSEQRDYDEDFYEQFFLESIDFPILDDNNTEKQASNKGEK